MGEIALIVILRVVNAGQFPVFVCGRRRALLKNCAEVYYVRYQSVGREKSRRSGVKLDKKKILIALIFRAALAFSNMHFYRMPTTNRLVVLLPAQCQIARFIHVRLAIAALKFPLLHECSVTYL